MPAKLKIDLLVDDRGSITVKRFGDRAKRHMHTAAASTDKFATSLQSIHRLALAAGAAFGAWKIGQLAGDFIEVASSFEQMEVKLDALTKGKGKETLDEINAWALEMPVNTMKAVDAFAMMQAMGLQPTIDKMETLVDVASIFGEDTMPRVARALGQMQTLGKLSAEELNQLAEAGINARKYLTEAFGMTVEELQKSEIAIEDIVEAIWQGLDADFSGAAKKAQDSWKGLTATFESYLIEIQRQLMEAGVFEELKSALGDINQEISKWIQNNQEWIKQDLPGHIKELASDIRTLVSFLIDAAKFAKEIYTWILKIDPSGITRAFEAYQQLKSIGAVPELPESTGGYAEQPWETGAEETGTTAGPVSPMTSPEMMEAEKERLAELQAMWEGYRRRDIESARAYDDELIAAHAETNAALLEMDRQRVEKERQLAEAEARSRDQALGNMRNDIMSTLQWLGKEHKSAFKVFKAIRIAETVIDTYKAAQGAYAALAGIPIVGPGLAVAAAAAAIAAGFARVSQIQAMEPGGGAGGGGGQISIPVSTPGAPSTGIPELPDVSEEKERPTLTINIHGDIMNEDYVELLAEKISEAVEDRDVTLIASNANYADNLS